MGNNWSSELFTAHAYGFHMGDTDGGALEEVWSNSYWITKDGEVYSFDFDFGAFSDKYDWSDESVSSGSPRSRVRILFAVMAISGMLTGFFHRITTSRLPIIFRRSLSYKQRQ